MQCGPREAKARLFILNVNYSGWDRQSNNNLPLFPTISPEKIKVFYSNLTSFYKWGIVIRKETIN